MTKAHQAIGAGIVSSAGRWAPETAAYLAAMTAAPSDARISAIDAFIRTVRAAPAWGKIDLLYLLAGHEDLGTRLNVVSPGNYTLSKSGTPLFITDGGWTDNGGSNYLDSGFNISSASGRKYAQDDAGIGVAVLSTGKSANPIVGAGANSLIIACTAGDVLRIRINQGSNRDISSVISTPKGVTGLDRTASNANQAYRGGATAGGGGSNASATVTSDTFKVLTNNGSLFGGQTVGMAWCGRALGATDQAVLRSAWVTYATAIGLTPE